VLWVSEPAVPVIVMVCFPSGAPDTLTVRTDDAVSPISGVTGFAPNTKAMPSGAPELVRLTGEKNTPSDSTIIFEAADALGGIDRYDGEATIAKSAAPAAIVTSRFNVCVSEPLVPFT